jgi:hypothetical protein
MKLKLLGKPVKRFRFSTWAITAPCFGSHELRLCGVGSFSGAEGISANGTSGPDTPPFTPQAPASEEIGLHVQAIKPGHVLRGIFSGKGEGGHGFNLEMVECETL